MIMYRELSLRVRKQRPSEAEDQRDSVSQKSSSLRALSSFPKEEQSERERERDKERERDRRGEVREDRVRESKGSGGSLTRVT